MSKNNKSNTVSVNKGMFAIIVILVALLVMFAIDLVVIYRSDIKDLANKAKNNSSEKVSNSSISLDNRIELNNLIDNDLVVLLYKEKLSDLTDLELRTITRFIKYKEIDKMGLTRDNLKKVFDNSVFSELKYEDGNIGGYCAGIVDDINMYTYDASTKTYNANPNVGMGCNMANPYIYTYNVDSYMDGDKYVIVNKYLFGSNNPNNKIEEGKYLFGAVNDYEDYLNGYRYNTTIDTSKSIVTLDNIGEEYVDMSLFASSLNIFTKDVKNYDSIKDKLDTYTYTFEKKDGHFVITDFSVEHSK